MTQRAHTLAIVSIISLALGLAACQTTSAVDATAEAPPPPAFVEAACAGCHAVAPPFLSPNPQSPSFEAIANRPGLNSETLESWLRDAHNYPEMMDFDLQDAQVKQVANYMLTLQREDYVPAP